MDTLLRILVIYLIGGLIALVMLDLLSRGKVRSRLKPAAYDTQETLARSGGILVGSRMALAILVVFTVALWPVAVWGALESAFRRGKQ